MLGLKFFNRKDNITALSAYDLFLTRKSVSKKEPCVFLPDKNNLEGTKNEEKYKKLCEILENRLKNFLTKKPYLISHEKEIMGIYDLLMVLETEKENNEFEKSEEKITKIDKILGTSSNLSKDYNKN